MRRVLVAATPTTRAIAVLALTQIIGWGTTYSLPAILVQPMAQDLGVASSFIFAGISAMLLVNATIAPSVGRLIDRVGAARVLQAGSLIAALGLLALGAARGPITYLLAWMVLGVAMASVLATPAFAVLVEIDGRGARRTIATLTLFTGLSSTIFWPVMLYLQGWMGWREIVWTFAALHVLICLPLHLWTLPVRKPRLASTPHETGAPALERASIAGASSPSAASDGPPVAATAPLDTLAERRAFWLIATAFASTGFVGWGLALQLPELFKDLGLSATTAITVAACAGPVQVLARGADMLLMGRTRAIGVSILACILLPSGLVVLAVTTGLAQVSASAVLAGSLVFIVLWATANGLLTVARAALPLDLFDPVQYGRWMGQLAVLQNIAFATAPVIMAATLHRAGPLTAIALAMAFALLALAAMVALSRLTTTRPAS